MAPESNDSEGIMQTRESIRKKALLAILFAGGMLNSHVPALSDNKIESTDSVMQEIANNTEIAPELKAYYLLSIASRYLDGAERTAVEVQFRSVTTRYSQWKLTDSE